MNVRGRLKKLEDTQASPLPFLVVSEQEGVLYASPEQLPVKYRRVIQPGDYLGQVITPEELAELEGAFRVIHVQYVEGKVGT